MIKAGIIGAAGYTGGETLRLLLHHPSVDIVFAHSKSSVGKNISSVHSDLAGETDLKFSSEYFPADVVFLCLGHGEARKFLSENNLPGNPRIIDLSQDHRLSPENGNFIYGLPELKRESIKNARSIANPGCFATAIQLALIPLAKENQLDQEIHITAITGSTGAGQSLSETSHFSWRNNNLSTYKPFKHQHLSEIGQSLSNLQQGFEGTLNFIPFRGGFTRGIFASIHMRSKLNETEARKIFGEFYSDAPFTHLTETEIDLKQVVNTNKCLVNVTKHGEYLHIQTAIDNLLKGASGQAVQNMNIMFGKKETEGLNLKPIAY